MTWRNSYFESQSIIILQKLRKLFLSYFCYFLDRNLRNSGFHGKNFFLLLRFLELFISLLRLDLLFLFLGFRLTGFEKLFFLLLSDFFILSLFNTLFNSFGPLVVGISVFLLMILPNYMCFIHLILYASAFGNFQFFFNLVDSLRNLYSWDNFDLIHECDSTYNNSICISL